jgi:hypothetical protein
MKNTPFITYKLDKERKAKLSTEAEFLIEEKGIILSNLLIGVKQTMADLSIPFYKICVILWACMVDEDKSLTPIKVGDLIKEYSNKMEAFTMVLQLAANAMPELTGKTLDELNSNETEVNNEDPN